jgi:hypothetical protein
MQSFRLFQARPSTFFFKPIDRGSYLFYMVSDKTTYDSERLQNISNVRQLGPEDLICLLIIQLDGGNRNGLVLVVGTACILEYQYSNMADVYSGDKLE